MKKQLAALAGAVLVLAPGAALAHWTKSYVIEWIEPANYYGAPSGIIDPGTDCPKGTNPEPDWVQMLVNAGYSRKEAEWIRNPANPERSAVSGNPKMQFRGKDFVSVYKDPESYPDPGLLPMEGKIAEGIDLDGDPNTGFTSPTGEPGIDNEFYHAIGCWKTYRGPPRLSSGAQTFNDPMREGAWTMVIVVAGEGDDPMNDPNVRVGLYMSGDPMVKSGDGDIVEDYTFTIKPDAKFEALYPARVVNGRITSTAPVDVMIHDPGYVRSGLELLRSRIDLTIQPDGKLKGFVGGYRPWKPVYFGWAGFGQVNEVLTWIDLPAAWYALKRNADFSPTGPGGEKTHISFALAVDAVPAFVMEPDASAVVAQVTSYKQMAQGPAAPSPQAAATGADDRLASAAGTRQAN